MRPAALGVGLAALALAASTGSTAQVAPSEVPPEAARPPGALGRRTPPNVFVSPSGEPFRAAEEAPYAAATWFRGADLDGDGRLTRAEFLRDAERFFQRLDADGNGVIDGFEIRAYEEQVAPEILPRIGRLRSGEGQDDALFHDRNGGVGREVARDERERRGRITASDTTFSGAGAFGMLNEPEPVQACDTDLDGRVSLAEWRAKAQRRFDLLDPKGLGHLSLDTLPKSYVQLQRERDATRRSKAARR